MPPVSIPVPDNVRDEVLALLQQVAGKLAPYHIALTDAEQKSLGSVNMGPASVSFAQDAGLLLTQHKEVVRRSITDEMIAGYPAMLNTFASASAMEEKAATVLSQITNIGLTAGAGVMGLARPAYKDGQNDQGQHPGVTKLVNQMSTRFAHDATVVPAAPGGKG